MNTFERCRTYLEANAPGKWYETQRFKNDSGGYIHQVSNGMVLLRVEVGTYRMFYWIYDSQVAMEFNQYITNQFNAEAHEIIVMNECRLFYDIDLKLDESQQYELAEFFDFDLTDSNRACVMNIIGEKLAHIYKEATLMSLEEHGNDRDDNLSGFDWMFCMRNRACGDGFKISIHIITNLFMKLSICSAVANDVKNIVLLDDHNYDDLGINESIADYLSEAIDALQYRPRGSLGLPMGVKKTDTGYVRNSIQQHYNIPIQNYLITIPDQFSIRTIELVGYDIVERQTNNQYIDSEFINEALKHVRNIRDYDVSVFDIQTSILNRSTMYVRRYAPSYCSVCNRTHDNDNTLFLIFNSADRRASWRCAHKPTMAPITFYEDEAEFDDAELEAFLNKHSRREKSQRVVEKKEPKKEEPKKEPIKKTAAQKKIEKELQEKHRMEVRRKAYRRKPLIDRNVKPLPKYEKPVYIDESESDSDETPSKKSTVVNIDVAPCKIPTKVSKVPIIDSDSEYSSDD